MRIGKLYFKFFLGFLAILIVTEMMVFGLFLHILNNKFFGEVNKVIKADKVMAAELIEEKLSANPSEDIKQNAALDEMVRKMGRLYEARIWITAPDGTLLSKSFPEAPPVILAGEIVDRHGFPHYKPRGSAWPRHYYLNAPFRFPRGGTGMMYMLVAEKEHRFSLLFALGLAAIGGTIALLIFPIYRFISKPLSELRHTALAIAEGDLSWRTEIKSTDEIGELAGAFNHMAETIERMVKTSQELTTNVSHELRSPLARIRIAQELLLENRGNPEQAQKYLESIQEEIEEMDHLIGQILALSKLDIRQEQGISENFDLLALVRELLDRFVPSIDHKHIRLDVRVLHSPLSIQARREEIRTALTNLLDNAAKFTPEEGEMLLAAEKAALGVKVMVMNTCEPIVEEDLKKIFEPFYRIHGKATRGTGLGLAITRKIVERHGGTLTATYSEGFLIVEMILPESLE